MTGKERINNICRKVPAFTELYNARVRHYIMKEHILNVFNQFEKYFSNKFSNIRIEDFKLFLLLHDIGKSIAYKQGDRNNQYNTTINEIKKHQKDLGISDDVFQLYKALLNASIIGKYMEGKAPVDEAISIILSECRNSKLPISDFFYFLSVYYQCDVASYTSDAGGIAYLEHLFEYQNGYKTFNETLNLLKFSNIYDQRYNLLYEKIQENLVAHNKSESKNVNTISTQDIHVKVVGKVDISKFERRKKEISKDKKNYYIIDTNVFVDYPNIISKIENQYPVILSAKVLDELDKLKATLNSQGKTNVQKALKSINQNIDKRDVRLEMADLSLLPDDFNKKSPDNYIFSVVLKFKKDNPILLTSDNGLQIKAKGLGFKTLSLKEFLK
ncbi:PIN domain-containing protein [Saccharicrinis sp. GN24d3]|uniref:PIN domain-containing protein n=1 Tax=Saccharicrinis sp. GN24d3 TaxID=3458416 RepID=UPI0040366193